MKKIILNSIAILGLSLSSIAQDGINIIVKKIGTTANPIVTGDNTDYSSGHTPFVYNLTSSGNFIVDMDVENSTASGKHWIVTRVNEDGMPSSWTNSICCGGQCFQVSTENPYLTPTSDPIIASSGGHGTLSLHFSTNSIEGSGLYTLYLTNMANTAYEDSVKIQVNFTLGINDLKSNQSFSLFPNPSNNKVSIQLNNNEKGNLKIVDVLGNIIYREEIISSSDINVSEFKNGIYFVTIETNGIQSQMEKLIVKH